MRASVLTLGALVLGVTNAWTYPDQVCLSIVVHLLEAVEEDMGGEWVGGFMD